ncbi:MAG: methionyl-tRNA formyltransferase [Pseudomonadota bacterium]
MIVATNKRSRPLPANNDAVAETAPKLGFAGTPEFAAVALRHLVADGYRPEIVLTQPDRPAGRGRKLTASAVKQFAQSEGLRVEQPESLKDPALVESLGLADLDCLIVAAYGLLLPQHVLEAPALGCVNIHASLLPRWRGAAPIVWALASGDKATGVCLMQMEAGLDTGPVLAEQRTPISARETSVELHHRLAQLGGHLLTDNLPALLAGELTPVTQDSELATYARKLSREDGHLQWHWSAREIDLRIRAFNPYPGCLAMLNGEPLKCWRSLLTTHETDAPPGTVLGLEDDGMLVATGNGVVNILEVQRPGRGRISAVELDSQSRLVDAVLEDAE